MLNYIKAELWKASRNRGMYALVLFLLLSTGLFAWTMLAAHAFAPMASAASTTMLLGILVAPLLTQVVDGGIWRTVKHEVSFGLSRRRIYLGKLAAGLLLGLGLCLLLLGGYLAVGWLVLPHGTGEEDVAALSGVGVSLMGALPVWCGVYSLCHMLVILIPSTAVWMGVYYLLNFFGQPILVSLMTAVFHMPSGGVLQVILMPTSLLMPNVLPDWLTWEYQQWCWLVGMGWLAATTGLGLFRFGRREIK